MTTSRDHCKTCGEHLRASARQFSCRICAELGKPLDTFCLSCLDRHREDAHQAGSLIPAIERAPRYAPGQAEVVIGPADMPQPTRPPMAPPEPGLLDTVVARVRSLFGAAPKG
jgi:hypothetical protein